MLMLRAGIEALDGDLDRAVAGFARQVRQHRDTAFVARTWLQHALPMPVGLKLAEYAAALHRSRKRLQRLRGETLALQFGGAAGTLAALGDKGWPVAGKLAEEPDLPLPQAAGLGNAPQRTPPASPRGALAHPSRPHRGRGFRVRHHRWDLRQDRPRRLL